MAGSKVLLCLFINNKFCYTDSVDDEDLLFINRHNKTLLPAIIEKLQFLNRENGPVFQFLATFL
jgi:hypothetical protein